MLLLEEIAESMSPFGMVAATIGCALALVLTVLIIRERFLSANSSEPVLLEVEEKDSDVNSPEPDPPVSAPPPSSAFKTYNATAER